MKALRAYKVRAMAEVYGLLAQTLGHPPREFTWRAPNNKVIRNVVPDYPNAVLVDWYAASEERPEYFTSDGIHLTAAGARAYADLIKAEVDKASADLSQEP